MYKRFVGQALLALLAIGSFAEASAAPPSPEVDLSGTWSDPAAGTIAVFDGSNAVVSLGNSGGEVYPLQKSGADATGRYQFTFLVPSSGFVLNETIVASDPNSITLEWANAEKSGTERWYRCQSATHCVPYKAKAVAGAWVDTNGTVRTLDAYSQIATVVDRGGVEFPLTAIGLNGANQLQYAYQVPSTGVIVTEVVVASKHGQLRIDSYTDAEPRVYATDTLVRP